LWTGLRLRLKLTEEQPAEHVHRLVNRGRSNSKPHTTQFEDSFVARNFRIRARLAQEIEQNSMR
jgi:hypothetical protein